MNDRCPCCHIPVDSKTGALVVNNGVPVIYCKSCYETFFGSDE